MTNQSDLETRIAALQKLSKINNYLLGLIFIVGVAQLVLLIEIARFARSIFIGMPTP